MITTRTANFVLLFALVVPGCEKKHALTAPDYDSALTLSYDAKGFLRQHWLAHIVSGTFGYDRFKSVAFLQFQVDGSDANPFILCLSTEALPHDKWGIENQETGSSVGLFGPPRDTPHPFARTHFSATELADFQVALEKSIEWHKLAVKEQLAVENRRILSLTNRQFAISFQKPDNSTNFFVTMLLPNLLPIESKLSEIALDQRGIEKLLGVVTNLPSRRSNYVAFRLTEIQQEQERREKAAKDKARADEILR